MRDALLKRLTFEAVNGEIDRAFAGELGTALRAMQADLVRVTAERGDYAFINQTLSGMVAGERARAEAAEAKVARLVEAVAALGKWCVENIPPDETMDRLLVDVGAALSDIKEAGESRAGRLPEGMEWNELPGGIQHVRGGGFTKQPKDDRL